MTNFRPATPEDAWGIVKLCQTAGLEDPLFLNFKKLRDALARREKNGIIAVSGDEIQALVFLAQEEEQKLWKVSRMVALSTLDDPQKILSDTLGYALAYLKKHPEIADIIYSTTRTLTPKQQELTIAHGFHVLGIFPLGSASGQLNGLTAFYLNDALARRSLPPGLHEDVEPFFDLIHKQTHLPKAPCVTPILRPQIETPPLPPLEFIAAPQFVAHHFRNLRAKRHLSVNFYPFQAPNTLITSPDQKIEIFLSISPEFRFASIIGERVQTPLDSISLYRSVMQMLYERSIAYIELINDAADLEGTDSIIKAGFLPCGYFPCLKKHTDARRDYVIFARSFENFHWPKAPFHKKYEDFIKAYLKNYLKQEKNLIKPGAKNDNAATNFAQN